MVCAVPWMICLIAHPYPLALESLGKGREMRSPISGRYFRIYLIHADPIAQEVVPDLGTHLPHALLQVGLACLPEPWPVAPLPRR